MGERKLRYTPTKAGKITCACATLHNYLIANKFHMEHDIEDDMLRRVIDLERNENGVQIHRNNNRLGEQRRNELVGVLRQINR